MLRGHIVIDPKCGLETVLLKGKCFSCGKKLKCTIEKALEQNMWGGYDYEDGGEGAAVHCHKCDEGNYITSLCHGQPIFQSGKFHNHCIKCPDFGECIGDYREAHCRKCGEHYFAGMAGSFSCNNCGGRRRSKLYKKANAIPLPSRDHWSGVVAGLREYTDATMSQIWTDPEANAFDLIFTNAMAASMGLPAREEGGHPRTPHSEEQQILALGLAGLIASLAAGGGDEVGEEAGEGGGDNAFAAALARIMGTHIAENT
jgi:hypothetical protein